MYIDVCAAHESRSRVQVAATRGFWQVGRHRVQGDPSLAHWPHQLPAQRRRPLTPSSTGTPALGVVRLPP